jgi:hypothetical protein
MSWYKISKKKSHMEEFEYGEEIRTMWNRMLEDEQDRVNIHFDLENNDYSDIKIKDLTYTDRDNQYRVKAQIGWAGGDWESPVCYFKCQFEDRTHFDRDDSWGKWSSMAKAIIIPEKNNDNLTKGEKGGLVAKQGEDGCSSSKINEKALWDEMVEMANKRIKHYWTEYLKDLGGDKGDSSFENTGCLRDLTGVYKK